MTAERWQQIEDLFHAALECDEAARPAFLAEACDGDRELRGQVEDLLISLTEAGDFIEASPVADALASSASDAAALIGRRVSHYEIQALLGAGGMGEVYLARDLKLDRQVALKLLPAQFTQDAAQVQRFEREARAVSALNHPNIIVIYEIGRARDLHFIATEFVAGQTLRAKLAGGQLALREALPIVAQIASALAAAHAAGIVHRDIKPENVMVRPDGLVKVVDFGLAKHFEKRRGDAATRRRGEEDGLVAASPRRPLSASLTDPTLLMGTLAYLSPEQVRPQAVDHRTDIFSLGVVLYELITGLRPFAGASAAAICAAILRDAPVLPTHLPAPLPRIIKRALAKDATARYQTANELLSDLQRLMQMTNSATASWWAGWRAKAALGVIALLLLTGLWVWRRVSGTAAAPFAAGKVIRLTDLSGQEVYPSFAPDGQTIVYAGFASGNWNIYLQKIGERQAVNLTPENKHFDFSPVFSPDGERIAFFSSRDGHGLFLMDRQGQILKRITDKGHNPSWSPDGREIALADDRIFDYEGRNQGHSSLFAVNVATGARRPITGGDAVQPHWSPHGHRIAYWGVHKGGQRDIWTVAAHATKGTAEPVAVTNDRATDWNPVWSRDGRHLYFLSNRGGSMNLWRVAIDEASGRVTGPPEPATLPSANSQHVSFSADGRALVYVEMNRREHTHQVAFDPVAGNVVGQTTVLTRGVRRHNSPAIAPDESALAFASQGEAQEDIFILDRDHAPPRQLTHDAAQDRAPRWAPDGQSIAFLSDRSGKYEVWRVRRDGSGLEQLTDARDAQVLAAVWSPDGRHLLYQVRDDNAFIIEPDQPPHTRTAQPLPVPPPRGFRPWAWSPDGRLLAGWQILPEYPSQTVIVYSFAERRYERLAETIQGKNPIWLTDSHRLLFTDLNKLYLLDLATKQPREILNVAPHSIGACSFSADNRRLYYSLFASEADVWLLPLQ